MKSKYILTNAEIPPYWELSLHNEIKKLSKKIEKAMCDSIKTGISEKYITEADAQELIKFRVEIEIQPPKFVIKRK